MTPAGLFILECGMIGWKANILLVEPDQPLAEMLSEHLKLSLAAGVYTATSAAEAFREYLAEPADLIITEARLPDADAFALIRDLHGVCDGPVILTTADATLGMAIEAMRLGVFDLLIKPFDLAYLTQVVGWAVEAVRAQRREQVRLQRFRLLARRLRRQRHALREQLDWANHQTVRAYRHLADRSRHHAMKP